MTKKRIILIGIIVIVAVYFILNRSEKTTTEAVPVKKGQVVDAVMQSGNVNAAGQTLIYAQTTGVVEEVYVHNGETVRAGDRIARIKSTSTEKEQAAAYANLLAAQSSRKSSDQSKITYQSQLEIARKGILDAVSAQKTMQDNVAASKNNPSTGKSYTQNEIDSINSAVESARAAFSAAEKKYLDADSGIASSQAGIVAAKLAYEATKDSDVIAPIDGTIVNLSVNKGGNTTATSATATGTQIARIADFSSFTIKINMNELAINKIKPNQVAQIQFDAIAEKKYIGRVSKVDDIGKEDQGLVTYSVEVVIENPDDSIKSGMTAMVEIEAFKKENVLYIPATALRKENNTKYVLLKKGQSSERKEVVTGIKGQQGVEIVQGLQENDLVIVESKK